MFEVDKFCNIIQHIGLLKDQADRINFILSDPLYSEVANDFVSPFGMSNPTIENDLIETLEEMYEDKDHWISYFVYELDFGRKWHQGMVTDAHGNDIRLASVIDLWMLIRENLNEND